MSNWYKKIFPLKTFLQNKNLLGSDDGKSVDFILVYDSNNKTNIKLINFEWNLIHTGLILERTTEGNLIFLKIHVPQEVLYKYAEILKLRMPLIFEPYDEMPKINFFSEKIFMFLKCTRLNRKLFPRTKYFMTAEFQRSKLYLYDRSHKHYFDTGAKINIASYILHRGKFGGLPEEEGIDTLLSEKIYQAAYPLHDGILNTDCLRNTLHNKWASFSNCLRTQPIDAIKDYFGVQIALYYSWLGFYTHMLVPAAIAGLVFLFYGIFTLKTDKITQDLCNSNLSMCPLCDKFCPFNNLGEACLFHKMSYLVDNRMIIFYAMFMSVWSIIHLELWNRYCAEITHTWGMTNYTLESQPTRPEYLLKMKESHSYTNFMTLLLQPEVPFWTKKFPSIIFSFSIIILWIMLVVIFVFSVVIYRMALLTSHFFNDPKSPYKYKLIVFTAVTINLAVILTLDVFYKKVAYKLTSTEFHRTLTEFDNSLMLKVYLFQAINNYSSIFYEAFLKGRYVGYPQKYKRIFGFRQEECSMRGCLMDLSVQLAFIMVGKQIFLSVWEFLFPVISTHFKRRSRKARKDKRHFTDQWIEDYNLVDWHAFSLSTEYIRMVIQYGFITLFVVAFPLAPLCALINNIFELRLDAKKMLKYYRRPVPISAKTIGVWAHILKVICKVSIISNAIIIAFTSDFIPKMYYDFRYKNSKKTYLDFMLSKFNVSDFELESKPTDNPHDIKICRYEAFRYPPTHSRAYERSIEFWVITIIRLLFVVFYQNAVESIINIIQWCIPEESERLKKFILKEEYEINEKIIQKEERHKRGAETEPEI